MPGINTRQLYFIRYIISGITVGSSFSVELGRDNVTNQQHHLFYDKWLRARFPDMELIPSGSFKRADGEVVHYGYRTNFPCVELTYDTHRAAHRAANLWLANHFQRPGLRDNDLHLLEWKTLEDWHMQELAEKMLQAAKGAGADIQDIDNLLNRIKNWNMGALAAFAKGHGCLP
jgi:hypothetical protein